MRNRKMRNGHDLHSAAYLLARKIEDSPNGSAEWDRMTQDEKDAYAHFDDFFTRYRMGSKLHVYLKDMVTATDVNRARNAARKNPETRTASNPRTRGAMLVPNKKRSRKRNSETGEMYKEDKLDEFSAKFQGQVSGEEVEVLAPDTMPDIVSRMGALASLTVIDETGEKYDIEFPGGGNAFAAADIRSNIHFAGEDARLTNIDLPKEGELMILGKLDQINYQTEKQHIEGGELVEYYHNFGEVDEQQPLLAVDHDGFPVALGGNYDIGAHGIEN